MHQTIKVCQKCVNFQEIFKYIGSLIGHFSTVKNSEDILKSIVSSMSFFFLYIYFSLYLIF